MPFGFRRSRVTFDEATTTFDEATTTTYSWVTSASARPHENVFANIYQAQHHEVVFGEDYRAGVITLPQGPTESPREVLIANTRQRARCMRERVAKRRAEALLVENLSDAQAAEWARCGQFHVETAGGRRRYRIRRGRVGNVTLVRAPRGERCQIDYCCHVVAHVPDADNCLAQKLLLEADEPAFLALANEYR